METEVYYHYEFWELRYIRIWEQKFISEDVKLVKLSTVLDIVKAFDFKLRFEWWDIEDEIEKLISNIEGANMVK